MDKTVNFFCCNNKRRKHILRTSNMQKVFLGMVGAWCMFSTAIFMLNRLELGKFMLIFASNIMPFEDIDVTTESICKVYPVLNSTSYTVIDSPMDSNIDEVAKNLDSEKENTQRASSIPTFTPFNNSAVDSFSYTKNNLSNLKISYTSTYQKVSLYGIDIANYGEITDIDYEGLINKNIGLARNKDKIFIYCTHTSESYVQSDGYSFNYTGTMRTKDAKYNMLSVANVLQDSLTSKNFNVVFDTTPHDYTSYDNAYTNSRVTIQNAINSNGKFGLMIDVHRDAYGDLYDGPIVEINGKDVAMLMLVVGTGAEGYENPYWETNLAIAMQIMKKGEEMYPGLFRPLLIRASKYNQDMNEGAFLVEVGNTGNTHTEVYYAISCLANILNEVIK